MNKLNLPADTHQFAQHLLSLKNRIYYNLVTLTGFIGVLWLLVAIGTPGSPYETQPWVFVTVLLSGSTILGLIFWRSREQKHLVIEKYGTLAPVSDERLTKIGEEINATKIRSIVKITVVRDISTLMGLGALAYITALMGQGVTIDLPTLIGGCIIGGVLLMVGITAHIITLLLQKKHTQNTSPETVQ